MRLRVMSAASGAVCLSFVLFTWFLTFPSPAMAWPPTAWNSFMGGAGSDGGTGIGRDAAGNLYVTGTSEGTWGGPILPYADNGDAHVAKFSSSGTLLWNTFLGSDSPDGGMALAVDGAGNVYVIGGSYDTWGSPQRAHAGGSDAFVAKLGSDGTLLWSTFLGSAGYETGYGVAVDAAGKVFVTGVSMATWEAPVRAYQGAQDGFAAKLDGDGTLLWNTFLGSPGEDYGFGIALDGSGGAVVSGDSYATWGSPVRAFSAGIGTDDAFVARVNGSGTLLWNTFLGSSAGDCGYGIAVDAHGFIYQTGYSDGSWGSPSRGYSGGLDAFVARLNGSGELDSNGFFGSAMDDVGSGLVFDAYDSLYVTGTSGGGWGPAQNHHGGDDAFVAKLAFEGALVWNSFLGSSSGDGGDSITVDNRGGVFVSGGSIASWGAPYRPHAGSDDAFLARLKAPSTDNDFGGDGRADILWRHTGGAFYLWQMQGTSALSVGYIPAIDPSWQVVAIGDLNGDAAADIVWRHTGGQVYLWMMQGATAIGLGSLGTIDTSWSVLDAADFGGDGRDDLLWRHTGGAFYLWQMAGVEAFDVGYIPAIDTTWQVEALADFNGDRKADILWRHTGGMLYLWLMDGATAIGTGSPGSIDSSWSIAEAADFTGDGRADILWRHTTGATAIWEMNGLVPVNVGMPGGIDPSWAIADASDFDYDGRADILWRHTSGAAHVWLMDGWTRIGEGSLGTIDPSWSIQNR